MEEEMHDLQRDIVGLRGVVKSFTTEQSRVSTWLITCMTQLMDASGQTYHLFNSTLADVLFSLIQTVSMTVLMEDLCPIVVRKDGVDRKLHG
ncbi:hypothetical protein Tco_0277023 [Tanacetum coccineum]